MKSFKPVEIKNNESIIDDFLEDVEDNHGVSGWFENGVAYLDIDDEDYGERLCKKYNFPFKVLPAYEHPDY